MRTRRYLSCTFTQSVPAGAVAPADDDAAEADAADAAADASCNVLNCLYPLFEGDTEKQL